jgi:hypothetical protein
MYRCLLRFRIRSTCTRLHLVKSARCNHACRSKQMRSLKRNVTTAVATNWLFLSYFRTDENFSPNTLDTSSSACSILASASAVLCFCCCNSWLSSAIWSRKHPVSCTARMTSSFLPLSCCVTTNTWCFNACNSASKPSRSLRRATISASLDAIFSAVLKLEFNIILLFLARRLSFSSFRESNSVARVPFSR